MILCNVLSVDVSYQHTVLPRGVGASAAHVQRGGDLHGHQDRSEGPRHLARPARRRRALQCHPQSGTAHCLLSHITCAAEQRATEISHTLYTEYVRIRITECSNSYVMSS